ncbi:uncharacterized protein TNCV_3629531 [Trichonephila clavipes]|nr:uncharacterized protein TNCV_3629531 [Trichonephila clavipes]
MCTHYSAIEDDKLVTLTSLVKTGMPQQKVQCVLWLEEFKSAPCVHQSVRTEWNVDPPTSKSINQWERTLRETRTLVSQTGKAVGSLVVRASDSRPEDLGPMPPNTLRVHRENVLVKSVGPKVLWAESRVQGTGEYFPPIQFHGKIVEEEIVVAPSIVPSENFFELNHTVDCMEA